MHKYNNYKYIHKYNLRSVRVLVLTTPNQSLAVVSSYTLAR